MKTAIIIADGVKQIMFTPETKTEREALKMITPEDDISTLIVRGTIYDQDERVFGAEFSKCQGGYLRAYNTKQGEESVMFVLTPKKKGD